MSLLLKLRAEQDQKDISLEYHKLQGFVYNLFRDSGFSGIHEKKGYKPFCFSNIFPFGDMKSGDLRNMIIASPSSHIIKEVARTLSGGKVGTVHIGDCSFTLDDFLVFDGHPGAPPVTIICGTPIILRIPERNYDIYGVPEEERKPRYVYWRSQIAFDAFVKQLSENLIKKYNDFYGTEIKSCNLFEQFIFKRPVYTRIIIDGRSHGVAASMWEFRWSYMNDVQRKVIGFAINAGFGERNSMGFGFVNVER